MSLLYLSSMRWVYNRSLLPFGQKPMPGWGGEISRSLRDLADSYYGGG
jgi:hypothetical protein